ncbi:MAG: tRNA pseudouridine(38-40) synthase TruA [Opitutaceae bacterium]|nr:tRNA pseudouridine(38-40) synthase TruA [Opitutaceae bacterium]
MTGQDKPAQQRWKCICAYDGGSFDGWQSQLSGRAVQDVIERRLHDILRQAVRIHGSGRTDAGVHALAQVFHFDASWSHGTDKLRAALQAGLPRTLQIKSIRRARPGFHARFSALGKIYRYNLYLGVADPFIAPYCWALDRPLDWRAIGQAAAILRGRHDFRALAARNGSGYENTVRDLRRLDVVRRGRRVRLTFEADGFLYKMVRSLTGALINVGLGKLAPHDIARLLESAPRPPAVQTAPPQGLFLVRVIY